MKDQRWQIWPAKSQTRNPVWSTGSDNSASTVTQKMMNSHLNILHYNQPVQLNNEISEIMTVLNNPK